MSEHRHDHPAPHHHAHPEGVVPLDPYTFGAEQQCFGCGPHNPVGMRLHFERDGDAGPFRYTGRYHQRRHNGASDVAICFGGDIAVTRVAL